MENIAGTKSSLTWAVHIAVAALVLLWLFPTVGLFVSSFRSAVSAVVIEPHCRNPVASPVSASSRV